jgi:hypothetical protein
MRMNKRVLLRIIPVAILVMPLATATVYAQPAAQPPAGINNPSPGLSLLPKSVLGFNLIDPSRMSMSHQFMSVYSSASKGMSSLYFNTITYQISDPLTLKLHLGYAFQPMGPRTGPYGQSSQVLPGFEMDYRPFGGKLNIHVGYNTPNYYYYPRHFTPYSLIRAR